MLLKCGKADHLPWEPFFVMYFLVSARSKRVFWGNDQLWRWQHTDEDGAPVWFQSQSVRNGSVCFQRKPHQENWKKKLNPDLTWLNTFITKSVQISANSSNDIAYWHLTRLNWDFKYRLSELSCKKSEKCLIKLQYRTGPCNTISYVTSHAFPHHFLSNIFM